MYKNFTSQAIVDPTEVSAGRFAYLASSKKKRKENAQNTGDNGLKESQSDLIQCEAGYNHAIILNQSGRVFSFGDGSFG